MTQLKGSDEESKPYHIYVNSDCNCLPDTKVSSSNIAEVDVEVETTVELSVTYFSLAMVGAFLVGALIGFLVFCFYMRRCKGQRNKSKANSDSIGGPLNTLSESLLLAAGQRGIPPYGALGGSPYPNLMMQQPMYSSPPQLPTANIIYTPPTGGGSGYSSYSDFPGDIFSTSQNFTRNQPSTRSQRDQLRSARSTSMINRFGSYKGGHLGRRLEEVVEHADTTSCCETPMRRHSREPRDGNQNFRQTNLFEVGNEI